MNKAERIPRSFMMNLNTAFESWIGFEFGGLKWYSVFVACGWEKVSFWRALGLFHRTMWQNPPKGCRHICIFLFSVCEPRTLQQLQCLSQVRRASWALGDDNQTTSTSQSFMWKQHAFWNKCQRPTMIQRNETNRSAAMYVFLWGFPFHLRGASLIGYLYGMSFS